MEPHHHSLTVGRSEELDFEDLRRGCTVTNIFFFFYISKLDSQESLFLLPILTMVHKIVQTIPKGLILDVAFE